MTNVIDGPEPEESYTDNLFGSANYAPEQPIKKAFLPWHKPRKQFVRDKQWSYQILQLVKEIEPENHQIKYLGLPGDDLLDLRYFHDTICVPNNIKLKFLGFNRGAASGTEHKSDLEISLDEVIKLQFINPNSQLIGDDFSRIAIPHSVAHDRAIKGGPYDIINIDLCEGFAQQPPSDDIKGNYFDTLQHLMVLQARQNKPWLLFITTRTDVSCIDPSRLSVLKDLYDKNLRECESFLAASTKEFSVCDRASLDNYCLQEDGTSNIFLTSLCKWIITLAIKQNPPAKVELKSTIGYKVKEEANFPDLISIAIKITPTHHISKDITGLASQADDFFGEGDLATKVINRLSKQVDADTLLKDDRELLESMINSSKVLLEKARYDIDSYSQWILTN